MKFAHKSGIVWKIYLIKLYICNANYPSIMFWIPGLPLISVWIYLTRCALIYIIT